MQDLKYYVFDLECYPNCFLWSGKFEGRPEVQVFEMSFRKNQRNELLNWLSYLQNESAQSVGYNNLGYDYNFTHALLNNPYTFTYHTAFQLNQELFSKRYGFSNVPYRDRILPQIDLMKINHFDNAAKRTSLKSLQFAMRSESVEDLPIEPGTNLTSEQIDQLIQYNIHDITETEKFLNKCKHLIEQRKEFLDTGVLTGDVLNFSDVKIGTEYLIKKIGRAKCFMGNTPRQTKRNSVEFRNIILPKITYRNEAYENVLEWFKQQVIYPEVEKAKLPQLEAKLANLNFHFGVGGVHASVESKHYKSNDKYVIKDIDVTGMYPAVAIANDFAPEHLGKEFSIAYKQLQIDRAKYKKGTSMNGLLKLAGNGVFGNSDNNYSCFYDPKYPKQITVNGQLQLLQLVELLEMIPGLEIIQANTDGVTAYLPRNMEYIFNLWKDHWEKDTGLKLEEVEYQDMWIRDVNNYLCVKTSGEVKRKGAYWYPVEDKDYDGNWNKDFSAMVVQKVIEQVLISGWKTEDVVKLMTDKFDFMIRYKTPKDAKVFIGDREMLKTVRYYVSISGEPMKKIAEPKGILGTFRRKNGITDDYYDKILAEIPAGVWDDRIHTKNKVVYEMTETSIEKGWLVKECNHASRFDWSDVDYRYYVEQIEKLKIGV